MSKIPQHAQPTLKHCTEGIENRMDLVWIPSAAASAWYATLAVAEGRALVDPALAQALAAPAQKCAQALAQFGDEASETAARTLSLPAEWQPDGGPPGGAKPGQAAGDSAASAALAAAWSDAQAAYLQARPRAAAELALRVDPLRGQWEARGPGLLAGLRRWTNVTLPPACLLLVEPVCGGGGRAHAPTQCVGFEALLANPVPALPEVLRLGWLLAQVHDGLPAGGDLAQRRRLARIARLASIPIVLAVAEEIELAHAGPQELKLALGAWLDHQQASDMLWTWWTNYLSSRPAWPVALHSLDRLLVEHGCEPPQDRSANVTPAEARS